MNARVILHAPTPAALARARSNLRNLSRADPAAEIRILANAGGVAAALEHPDPDADRHLLLCQNSLHAQQLTAPAHIAIVPAAVQTLVELQAAGWIYIRA